MNKNPAADKVDQLLDAYRSGDYAASERLARGVTRKWPGFDLGWNILSASLHALGKLDKAAEAYRRALSMNPDHAELHDHYGALLIQQGRPAEAAEHFRRSLALDPGSARTHANLGTALLMTEQLDAAVEHCRRAVALEPADAALRNTLGNALKAVGQAAEARAAYEESVRLNSYYSKAHFNLAAMCQDAGEIEAAERHYRLAVQSNPDYAKARCSLGNLLAMSGRLDEARQTYREALARRPDLAEAHRYLAWLKTFRAGDPDLAAIEEQLATSGLRDADRAQLHYAAGKAYQDIGDQPRRAFEHFSRGAKLTSRRLDYDVGADEALFREIAAAYPVPIEVDDGGRSDSPATVFIVGMPRSGTTLVEQVLGAHSRVFPLGEAPFLPQEIGALNRALGSDYPRWVDRIAPGELEALGKRYLEAARSRCSDAAVCADKMTDNFKYLGIIARALPGARIVHVLRSPLDTCVSCYTQYFSSPVEYSYDLVALGRYYRAYHELMSHWRQVMPAGMMMELEYESLVGDPVEHIRRVLEHCGLEWEERCLAFQESRRLIETASVAQVRQPLNPASVGRWKVYEPWLDPLKEALGELAC